MRIRKFKDFKRRPKTRIKKVSDAPYAFVPTVNQKSPAPAVAFPIFKLETN